MESIITDRKVVCRGFWKSPDSPGSWSPSPSLRLSVGQRQYLPRSKPFSSDLFLARRREPHRSDQSPRRASVGSVLVARQAGSRQATSAVAPSPADTARLVVASRGDTPKSRLPINRDDAAANPTPTTDPARMRRRQCRDNTLVASFRRQGHHGIDAGGSFGRSEAGHDPP